MIAKTSEFESILQDWTPEAPRPAVKKHDFEMLAWRAGRAGYIRRRREAGHTLKAIGDDLGLGAAEIRRVDLRGESDMRAYVYQIWRQRGETQEGRIPGVSPEIACEALRECIEKAAASNQDWMGISFWEASGAASVPAKAHFGHSLGLFTMSIGDVLRDLALVSPSEYISGAPLTAAPAGERRGKDVPKPSPGTYEEIIDLLSCLRPHMMRALNLGIPAGASMRIAIAPGSGAASLT